MNLIQPKGCSWPPYLLTSRTGAIHDPKLLCIPERGSCDKTVSKSLRFEALELCLSEKQMPQVVVFINRRQNQ